MRDTGLRPVFLQNYTKSIIALPLLIFPESGGRSWQHLSPEGHWTWW